MISTKREKYQQLHSVLMQQGKNNNKNPKDDVPTQITFIKNEGNNNGSVPKIDVNGICASVLSRLETVHTD